MMNKGLVMSKKILYLVMAIMMLPSTIEGQVRFAGKQPAYDSLTNTWLLTVPSEYFGAEITMDVSVDETVSTLTIDSDLVSGCYTFSQINDSTSYLLTYQTGDSTVNRTLRFTYLPTLQLYGSFDKSYKMGSVCINLPEESLTDTVRANVRWAGGSTAVASRGKHNYHIKFVDSQGQAIDRSFFGLRSDNHWRLDAGQIDMMRIRNTVATRLWADFASKPYYADRQSGAKSYVRGDFVEVFVNDEYAGFFCLNEHLDRYQMRLKKYDAEQKIFHGLLWKVKSASQQAMFSSTDDCNNNVEQWSGIYVKYPDFDDVHPTDYGTFYQLVNFVLNSSDSTFNAQIAELIDWPVMIDYYLLINLLCAKDNVAKNMYWACYDQAIDPKLTLAVWDLDATAGQNWQNSGTYYRDGSVSPEYDVRQMPNFSNNKLFQRLLANKQFTREARARYWQLRRTVFNPDSLIQRYAMTLARLNVTGALNREVQRWSGKANELAGHPLDFTDEMQYVADWWQRRIAFLDANIFTYLQGDVNEDGIVNVADIATLIDCILEGNLDDGVLTLADVNGDGHVDLGDISMIINIMLQNQ